MQIFQNLIGNSIQYRGDKAPKIHVEGHEQRLAVGYPGDPDTRNMGGPRGGPTVDSDAIDSRLKTPFQPTPKLIHGGGRRRLLRDRESDGDGSKDGARQFCGAAWARGAEGGRSSSRRA